MKKLTCITIIITILLSLLPTAVLAQEAGMTIEAIQNQAVLSNIQSAIDELDIKNKENNLKQAQEDAKWQNDAYGPLNVLNNRITRDVKPLEALAKLEEARKIKRDNIIKTRQGAYKQALKILLLNKQYDNEKQKLEIVNERLEMAKTRFAAKSITDNELADAEYNLECKKLDLSNISQQLDVAGMELNKLFNKPLTSSSIEVNGELILEKFSLENLDNVVTAAFENNTSIYVKSKNLEAAQKTMDLTTKLFKNGESAYDSNFYNLEAAKGELDDTKRNLETDIRNKYNNLLTNKGKVELSQKYMLLLQKKLISIETKYKKGVESKDSLLSAKEKYMDSQYGYYSAILDHNMTLREFSDMIK